MSGARNNLGPVLAMAVVGTMAVQLGCQPAPQPARVRPQPGVRTRAPAPQKRPEPRRHLSGPLRFFIAVKKDPPPVFPLPHGLRFDMGLAAAKKKLAAQSALKVNGSATALQVSPGTGFGWSLGAVRLLFDTRTGLQQVSASRSYATLTAANKAFAQLRKPLDKKLKSEPDKTFGVGVRYKDSGHHLWLAVDKGSGFGKAVKTPSLVFVRTAAPLPLKEMHDETRAALRKLEPDLKACNRRLIKSGSAAPYRVSFDVIIAAMGDVDDVNEGADHGKQPATGLSHCWSTVLKRLKLPENDAPKPRSTTITLGFKK